MVKKTETKGPEPTEPALSPAPAQPGFFQRIAITVRSLFPRRSSRVSDISVRPRAITSIPKSASIDIPDVITDKSVEINIAIPKVDSRKPERRKSFRERRSAKSIRNNTKKSRVNRSLHKGAVSDFGRIASTYENVDAIKDDPRLKFLSWCRGARYDDYINELQKTYIKEAIFNQEVLIETCDGKSIAAGIRFSDLLTVRAGPLYLSAGNENKGRDVYEDDPALYQKKLELACQKIKASLSHYAEYRAEGEQQRKYTLNKSSRKMLQIMANELNTDMLQALLSAADFENAYANFKEGICKKYEFVAAEHEKIDWFFRTAIANTQKFLLPQLARKLSDFDLVMENEERLISALKAKIGEIDPEISVSAIKRFAQSFWQLGAKLDLEILRQITKNEALSYTEIYVIKHRELCVSDKPSPETHTLITSTKPILRKIIPQSLAEENVNPVQIDTSYGLGISYNGPELITNLTNTSTRWSHHIFREAETNVLQMINNKEPSIMASIEENAQQRKIKGAADMDAIISATEQVKNQQIKQYIETLGYSNEDSKRISQHKGIFEHGDVICDTSSYFAKYINNDSLFASFLKNIECIIQAMPVSIDDKNAHIQNVFELIRKFQLDGISIGSQMESVVEFLNHELKDEAAIKSINACCMQYYQGLLLYDNLSLFEEAGKKWSQCQIFSPLHKTEKYFGNMFDVAQAVVPTMSEIERKSEDMFDARHRTPVIDEESKPYRMIDKSLEIIRLKAQIQVLKLCFRLDFVRFYLHRDYLLSSPAAGALHANMNPSALAVIADIDKRTYLRRHIDEMMAHPERYSEDRVEALQEVLKNHEDIVAGQLKYFNEKYEGLIEFAYDMKGPDIPDWDEDLDLKLTDRSPAVTNPDFTDDFVVGMPRYSSVAPELTVNYLKEKCPDLVTMLQMYVSPIKSADEKINTKDPVDEILEKMVTDFKKRIVENYQFRDVYETRLSKKERTKINFPVAGPEHIIESGNLSPVGKRIQSKPEVENRERSNSDPTSNLHSWNSKLKRAGSSRKKIDVKNPEDKRTHKPGSDHSKKP